VPETPLSAVTVDLGERFKLVDMVPAVIVAVTIGLFFLGDRVVATSADEPWWWSAGLLVGVAFIGALALRPFQVRLVRYMEGYWKPGRLTGVAFDLGVQRHRGRKAELTRLINEMSLSNDRIHVERADWAREQLRRYPADHRILPTALGNALRSAEDLAGSRYGLSAPLVFPRMFGLTDDSLRGEYASLVDQYDSNARLSVSAALASVVCCVIALFQVGVIGLLPLAGLGIAWLFYKGAVESAALSGEVLGVIIEVSRFDLLDRLRVPLPGTPGEEFQTNQNLMKWFADGEPGEFPVDQYRHPAP
jgi:hypothetical protein